MVVEVINTLWNPLAAKQWSIYPFIPSLFSLFISFYLVPIYNDLYGKRLAIYLKSISMGEKFEIINGIAKDRGLQVGYLTGIPAVLTSLLTTLKSDHPYLLTGLLFTLIFPMIILFLKVFMQDPGYHSTTRFPEKARPEFVFKKGWTYLNFYSKMLALLNILLIVVTFISLPQKH